MTEAVAAVDLCGGGSRVPSWFTGAGLGLFVTWDHASQQGVEISWPIVGGSALYPGDVVERPSEYHATAATFDPLGWDPAALASLARAAGARYAVFTAKHCSGWAAWPSQVAGAFTIASSPYGQRGGDLVRDFVTAFRDAGLRVGLYFSLPDWTHPDYAIWPPNHRPYTGRPAMPEATAWQRYRAFLKAQLTELLTQYGEIDLLWFDGDWERTASEWDSADLSAHIRSLAPNIVINDRLPGHGNYRTPENYLPGSPLTEPWETCLTMGTTWAYVPQDSHLKSSVELLKTLVEVTSRGGNLLLNVGPTGEGVLIDAETDRLRALAEWMRAHHRTVHDVMPGVDAWQFYGPSTRSGNTVYLFLLGWPPESVGLRGVHVLRARSVRLLATGEEMTFWGRTSIADLRGQDPVGELVIDLPPTPPRTLLPVVAIDFDDQPTPLIQQPWLHRVLATEDPEQIRTFLNTHGHSDTTS